MPSLTTFGIAVFVLALSVPVIADDESRPLLDVSRQVGTMEGAPEPHYWWLTDNKIVYFEHVRHIPTPAELRELGKVPPDYAPGHFRAFTLRVSDGKRAPMDSLNATFGNDVAARPMLMSYGGGPSTETKYMLPSCAVSPDRKWFTWKSPTAWFAVKLDGTSKRRWPSKAVDGYVAWFAGTRCALVVSDYRHGGLDIFLSPAFHGRGLGREALLVVARWLIAERGHHRLIIDPAAANTRAIRTYTSLGFKPVGVMRRY